MKKVLLLLAVAFVAGCGERGSSAANKDRGLAMNLTIREALVARNEGSVDILVEKAATNLPSVSERVTQIKAELDNRRVNNSICVASHRGTIGKTAFVCNDYDYDLMILAKPAGQRISENLRYIAEFAEEPLRSGLVDAIAILSTQPVDETDADCVRLVFEDSASNKVRADVPIIVMIRPPGSDGLSPVSDSDLRSCLE